MARQLTLTTIYIRSRPAGNPYEPIVRIAFDLPEVGSYRGLD